MKPRESSAESSKSPRLSADEENAIVGYAMHWRVPHRGKHAGSEDREIHALHHCNQEAVGSDLSWSRGSIKVVWLS